MGRRGGGGAAWFALRGRVAVSRPRTPETAAVVEAPMIVGKILVTDLQGSGKSNRISVCCFDLKMNRNLNRPVEVLLFTDENVRSRYSRLLEASERRFYDWSDRGLYFNQAKTKPTLR